MWKKQQQIISDSDAVISHVINVLRDDQYAMQHFCIKTPTQLKQKRRNYIKGIVPTLAPTGDGIVPTTLINFFIAKGRPLDEILLLVKYGENINGSDVRGWTPIILAVSLNKVDILLGLFMYARTNGLTLDVNHMNKEGVSALYFAAENGYTGMVSLLLQNGADMNQPCPIDNCTPLIAAVDKGMLKVVNILLAQGNIDLNSQTKVGSTALYLAVERGRYDIVAAILEKSAECINTPINNGFTPLMCASQDNNWRMVELLLKYGAKPNLCMINVVDGSDGLTALHLAAMQGHADAVMVLLDGGADSAKLAKIYDAKNPVGPFTAFECASMAWHTNVVEVFTIFEVGRSAPGSSASSSSIFDTADEMQDIPLGRNIEEMAMTALRLLEGVDKLSLQQVTDSALGEVPKVSSARVLAIGKKLFTVEGVKQSGPPSLAQILIKSREYLGGPVFKLNSCARQLHAEIVYAYKR